MTKRDKPPRPRIDEARTATSSAASTARSAELAALARETTARNEAAMAELGFTPRPTGTCAWCFATGTLHVSEPTQPESDLVCIDCVRAYGHNTKRYTPCDNDPSHGAAWRDPKSRRNEYLCGNCHAANGHVIQNRWARVEDLEPRVSLPLGVRDREACAARNVAGTKDCRGEVKPRGAAGTPLCNAHAGVHSAGADYFGG